MKEAQIFYIEGPDGSGKTTLISKLRKLLENQGKSVYIAREPGGKNVENLREMLLDPNNKMSYVTRRLLFLANHAETMDELSFITGLYDIIIIDRTAVISDAVYGHMSILCDKVKPTAKELYDKIQDMYSWLDERWYKGIESNSKIIFIDISDKLLYSRLSQRKQQNDINDIKSMDFKISINHKYKRAIYEIEKNNADRVIRYDPEKEKLSDLVNKMGV